MEYTKTIVYKKAEEFFPFWGKEVKVVDSRSAMGPETICGTVIGIRLDAILLRIRGIITDWYPINHSQIEWKI